MKATGPWGLILSGTVQSRSCQFWTGAETTTIFLIFLLVNTFSLHHYWYYIKTRLLKFAPLVEITHKAVFSWKESTIDSLSFSIIYIFIFFKKVFSQNNETGPTMVGRPLQKLIKILYIDFTILWWHLCEFLENKKGKKSLNSSFYHYQVFS